MQYGIVYAMDGVLYDGDTHDSLGLATTLVELDAHANVDIGTLVYTKDVDGATEVGLIGGGGIRIIDAEIGRVTLKGKYQNLLNRGSRLIVTTDEAALLGFAGVHSTNISSR